MGSIFLKDEGGYKIILRALEHYKKRLRSIASSPELKDNPMFAQVVEQEAMKVYPKIGSLIVGILQSLENFDIMKKIESNTSLILRALDSYKTDIQKAMDSKDDYYLKLIDLSQISKNELSVIQDAIKKIQEYS